MSLSKGILKKIILQSKESSLQTKARNYVNSKEGMFWLKINDRYTSGIPDVLIIIRYKDKNLYPERPWNTRYVWIEFKASNGKQKKIQEFYKLKLEDMGCEVHLIRSMDHLKEVIG